MNGNGDTEFKSIAFIGNFLPRRCGIATFTTDLLGAVAAETSSGTCFCVAMNDTPEGYRYPQQVRFEINQNNLSDYKRAAEFLNMQQADVVCLQHEYGIFGGPAGSAIMGLLRSLRMPVVTTLHTVLREPGREQAEVMRQLIELSERLMVMSRKAFEFLVDLYDAPAEKIVFIHHGIPDTPFIDPSYYKDQFGVEGRKVMLTFGLLSPGKGIEYVLQALPAVAARHPDLAYIVLGATHPHVLKACGEEYRLMLQHLAKNLGIADNVIFQNRFVSIEELCEFLGTADLYVTPYCGADQITSGTLAYALGTGKAVISTPYWYAAEMLDEGRGRLVPFKNPEALAAAINDLLDNDIERNAMRKRAYTFSRAAVWREVARRYLGVFAGVKAQRAERPRPALFQSAAGRPPIFELPDINLGHLQTLTDDTGILQHATYTLPNRNHGYCTDDNARALIVAALARKFMMTGEPLILRLCSTYLGFLQHAFSDDTDRFRNFMTYDRRWLEEQGSEDSHGRAIWGLGVATACLEDPGLLSICATLFNKALKAVPQFEALRPGAFANIGIHAYLARYPGDTEAKRIRALTAQRLYEAFQAKGQDDWPWPEGVLSYANARLPHALILSGQWMSDGDMFDAGLRALDWLCGMQLLDGHFAPIGNHGWYVKGGSRARFDQQPIEAHAMMDACIEAFNATQDRMWLDRAVRCFNWFLGDNDLGLPLYRPRTGGCCDGLMPDGVNQNEGAESTLAWLLALTALHKLTADNILKLPARDRPARAAEQPPAVSAQLVLLPGAMLPVEAQKEQP
jgi:glycosyltransferase involved in cell wall biosynthesis